MKKIKSKMTNAVFGFLPFAILCIVPIFSMLAVWSFYSHSLYKQVCNVIANEEKVIANTMSDVFTRIGNTYTTMTDERFKDDIVGCLNGDSTYKSTLAVTEEISGTTENSSAIESIYVYSRCRDLLISNCGLTDSRLFYLANFDEKDFSYEEWMRSIELGANAGVFAELSGIKSNYVNYTTKFEQQKFGDDLVFGAIIDKNSFFVNGESSDWRRWCGTYIFNSRNEIIFKNAGDCYSEKRHIGTKIDIDGLNKNNVILQTFIPLQFGNGYQMYTVIPKDICMQLIRPTNLVAIFIVAVSIVLMLVVLVWIAKKNYKPILDAVMLLGGDMKMEYAFITDSIKNLIESKDELREKISYRQDIFRNIIFEKLIRNELNEEMRFLLNEYGIDFKFEFFAVMVFNIQRIIGDAVINNVSREMIETVEKAFTDENNQAYVFEHNERLVCIINTNKAAGLSAHSIAQIAAYCASMLKSKFYFDVQMGISDIHRGLENISLSYFEATEALLSEKMSGGSFIKLYSDITDINVKYLSFDSEDKILGSIREGNAESALNEIEKIFRVLDSDESPAVQCIEYDLICMMLKLSQTVGSKCDDSLKSMLRFSYFANAIGNTADLKRKITELTHHLCEYINDKKHSEVRDVVQISIDYIEKYYSDANLSVEKICTYLGMSQVHLTALFKRVEGTTPGVYINRYRIDKAKHLLRETDMSVQAITSSVGYLSTRTFDRVFKKYTGKTPKEYRDTTREDI